jgi:hypothetical protein
MLFLTGSPKKSTVIALTSVIALSVASVFAQYGEFQIGDEPVSPRLSAMGSAGAALPGGGFCFYNPASPAFAPAPFLSAEFGQIPGDLSRSLVETAWMFPRWFAGASMRVHSVDFGVTTEQTDDPASAPLSTEQSLQACLDGGFAFESGRAAAGATLNFFQQRTHDQIYRAWTLSPGIVYRLVPGKVNLAASLDNFIRLDTARSPWYRTPRAWYEGARALPRYARVGGAWTDTLRAAVIPFTLACDVVYSEVYDLVMVPIGAEAWVTPYLAARAGVRINHPTDKAHFGAGVRWSNIMFDFDYGITQPVASAALESKWLFGLTYTLKQPAAQKRSVTQPLKNPQSPSPEPRTFAPPKRILLTPKPADSMKTPPSTGDSVSTKGPGTTKSDLRADTTAAENPRPPRDTIPVAAPAPVVPVRTDSVATPDTTKR